MINVPVAVAAGTPVGSLANTATVTNAGDPNPDNNTVTDEGAVSEAQFDLSVDKRVTSSPTAGLPGYFPGAQISYELHVRNNGTQPAPDVMLTDTLPPELESPSASAPPPATCTGADCNLGTIAPGGEVTMTLTATLTDDLLNFPSSATLVNRAEVEGAGTEIDPSDNTAEASILTEPHAEISVTKTFAPAQPAAGGPITYTITIRNDGPGTVDMAVGDVNLDPSLTDADFSNNDAFASFVPGTVDVGLTKTRVDSGEVPVGGETVFRLVARNDGTAPGSGVEVRDSLPTGLTPVAVDPECTIAGQDVVCRLDELGAGDQRAFEVRARAEPSAAGRTLTNSRHRDGDRGRSRSGGQRERGDALIGPRPQPVHRSHRFRSPRSADPCAA